MPKEKPNKLVRFGTIGIVIISTICGVVMIKASSFLLLQSVEIQNSVNKTIAMTTLQTLDEEDVFSGVNTRGESLKLYRSEVDAVFHTQIFGSGTALVGGCLQFLVSILTLVLACRDELKGQIILIWIAFHALVTMAIYGSYLSITTNNREIKVTHDAMHVFLPACLADLVILVVSLAIELIFIRMYIYV